MAGGIAAAARRGDGRVTRARGWWSRARRADGHERQTLLMIGKSALAATIAWYVADDVIGAEAPAFAPFSAVLVMQATVYRSGLHALRFVVAVCAGVAIQGALGFLVGPNVVAFAAVALVALAIGRWPRLTPQGTQVATAAFFAFSMFVTATGTPDRLTQLGMIIILVLVGCGIGLAVNLVAVPPLRYRSAEYGVRAVASSLHDLMDEIAETLRDVEQDGELDADRISDWRWRVSRIWPLIDQARASVRTARESFYLNPRRLLTRRTRATTFAGHEEVIEALARVTDQIASLTRSLDQATDDASGPARGAFLHQYADLLARLSYLPEILADLDDDRIVDQTERLDTAAREAEHLSRGLAEDAVHGDLPLSDPTRPYGVLLVEATRLTEEFRHTTDVFHEAAGA